MPSFPIVDSHVHLWDPKRFRYPWLATVKAIERPFLLKDYNEAAGVGTVDTMVFLECDVEPALALDEARWVAEQAKIDPRIQAIVPHASLEKGNAALPELEALAEIGLVHGVRRLIQAEPDVEFCLRPGFIEGVKLLPRFGFSFDICIYHHQLASVIRLVDLCPEVPMVLDHIGKPGIRDGLVEPWRSQIVELARRDNVACKISGVATEADHQKWNRDQIKRYMMTAIEAFGPNRLMFGGDWPVSTLAIKYPEWIEVVDEALSAFSEHELRSIYRDTAIDFYRIAA